LLQNNQNLDTHLTSALTKSGVTLPTGGLQARMLHREKAGSSNPAAGIFP